jgi:hypothetical protein
MSHYLIMRRGRPKSETQPFAGPRPALGSDSAPHRIGGLLRPAETGEEERWLQKATRPIAAITPAEGLNREARFL